MLLSSYDLPYSKTGRLQTAELVNNDPSENTQDHVMQPHITFYLDCFSLWTLLSRISAVLSDVLFSHFEFF